MKQTKKHKHWVYGTKWQRNVLHPVSQKHHNPASQLRHDMATGKVQRWAKRKGLMLTDSTYRRYVMEVMK